MSTTTPAAKQQVSVDVKLLKRKASQTASFFSQTCIIRCPTRIELLIWMFGFLFMLTLTIKDFRKLIDAYYYDNEATKFQIDNAVIPPNISVCLPYFRHPNQFYRVYNAIRFPGDVNNKRDAYEYCDYLKNHTRYDFRNHIDMEPAESDRTAVRYVIETFMESGYMDNRKETEEEDPKWMDFVMDTLFTYFFWINYGTDIWSLTMEDYRGEQYDYIRGASNEQIRRLHKMLIDFIKRTMRGSGCTSALDSQSSNPNSMIFDFDHVTIWWNAFCFAIPTAEMGSKDFRCTYKRDDGWTRTSQQVEGKHGTSLSSFEVFRDQTPLYSEFASKDALYSSRRQRFITLGPEYVGLTYQIMSKVIARKPADQNEEQNGDNDCSTESNPEICVARGQLRAAAEYCGCVPFTYDHLLQSEEDRSLVINGRNISTLPFCNTTHFAECQPRTHQTLSRLREECNNKCENVVYEWPSISSILRVYAPRESTTSFWLDVKASRARFITFSLTQQTSLEQFLASLGGSINLYIGGSGLTLFALLIIGVEQLMKWYTLKNRESNGHQGTEYSEALQAFRTVSLFRFLGTNDNDKGQKKDTTDCDHNHQQEEEELDRMRLDLEELREIVSELRKDDQGTKKDETNEDAVIATTSARSLIAWD